MHLQRQLSAKQITIMTCRILFIGVFLTYLLLILQQQMFVHAVESGGNNYATTGHNKQGRNRMLSRFARPQNQFNKVKPEIFNEFFGNINFFFYFEFTETLL